MNENNKNLRAFIAISLPEKVIDHLENLQSSLKGYKIKASWANPSNMHLTLKFLGEIPTAKVQDINQCISASMLDFKKEHEKLSLFAEGIGVFPSVNKPRVVWAGISSGVKGKTNSLEIIHSFLETHLEKAGFEKEKKRFFPHITLGRIKKPVSQNIITEILKKHADNKSGAFLVKEITLFKSQLTFKGAIHTKLFSQKI